MAVGVLQLLLLKKCNISISNFKTYRFLFKINNVQDPFFSIWWNHVG